MQKRPKAVRPTGLVTVWGWKAPSDSNVPCPFWCVYISSAAAVPTEAWSIFSHTYITYRTVVNKHVGSNACPLGDSLEAMWYSKARTDDKRAWLNKWLRLKLTGVSRDSVFKKIEQIQFVLPDLATTASTSASKGPLFNAQRGPIVDKYSRRSSVPPPAAVTDVPSSRRARSLSLHGSRNPDPQGRVYSHSQKFSAIPPFSQVQGPGAASPASSRNRSPPTQALQRSMSPKSSARSRSPGNNTIASRASSQSGSSHRSSSWDSITEDARLADGALFESARRVLQARGEDEGAASLKRRRESTPSW